MGLQISTGSCFRRADGPPGCDLHYSDLVTYEGTHKLSIGAVILKCRDLSTRSDPFLYDTLEIEGLAKRSSVADALNAVIWI